MTDRQCALANARGTVYRGQRSCCFATHGTIRPAGTLEYKQVLPTLDAALFVVSNTSDAGVTLTRRKYCVRDPPRNAIPCVGNHWSRCRAPSTAADGAVEWMNIRCVEDKFPAMGDPSRELLLTIASAISYARWEIHYRAGTGVHLRWVPTLLLPTPAVPYPPLEGPPWHRLPANSACWGADACGPCRYNLACCCCGLDIVRAWAELLAPGGVAPPFRHNS